MKASYVLRVLSGVRFKKIFSVVDKVHQKSGMNKIAIIFDMLVCSFKYGAGYNDYHIFAFYSVPKKNRWTYLTRFKNKKLIEYCNSEEDDEIFDDKCKFNEVFKDYIKRDFLDARKMTLKDFEKFMSNKEVLFAKPTSAWSGKGIEKLNKKDFKSIKEMYDYLKAPNKNFGIIEQEIIQHKVLSDIYPYSVNSLRVCTLVGDDGVPHILFAVAKFGNEGKHVDNMENSGLGYPVDLKTGRIYDVAHTSPLINYDRHPYTNAEVIGTIIPYFDELKDLVLKAALVVKSVRYVGWDVCIGKDGPIIIEGNNYSGHDFWQIPEWNKERIGLIPVLQEYLPGLKF